MKFNELLEQFGETIEEKKLTPIQLIKLQLYINNSYIASCDDITRVQLEKNIKNLNSFLKEIVQSI